MIYCNKYSPIRIYGAEGISEWSIVPAPEGPTIKSFQRRAGKVQTRAAYSGIVFIVKVKKTQRNNYAYSFIQRLLPYTYLPSSYTRQRNLSNSKRRYQTQQQMGNHRRRTTLRSSSLLALTLDGPASIGAHSPSADQMPALE